MVLPVPLMTALVASIGLEGALMIADRFARGTNTPADDAIIAGVQVGTLGLAIASPVATARAGVGIVSGTGKVATSLAKKAKKRKKSAYNIAYGKAYKEIRSRNTLKNGKLRKGYTHKRIVNLAHKKARGAKK